MKKAIRSLASAINWFNTDTDDEDRQLSVVTEDEDDNESVFFNREDGPLTVTYTYGEESETTTIGDVPLTEKLIFQHIKRLPNVGALILENGYQMEYLPWSHVKRA